MAGAGNRMFARTGAPAQKRDPSGADDHCGSAPTTATLELLDLFTRENLLTMLKHLRQG
jgi:hypothetical protein